MAFQVVPVNAFNLQVPVSRSHSLVRSICDPLRLSCLIYCLTFSCLSVALGGDYRREQELQGPRTSAMGPGSAALQSSKQWAEAEAASSEDQGVLGNSPLNILCSLSSHTSIV